MRRILISVTAAALIAGTAGIAHADPITCTVEGMGTNPSTVVLGTEPQAVQFWVSTSCDAEHDVDWELISDQYVGSGASWLMLRNWDRPGGEKYTFVEQPYGYFTINPLHSGVTPGNAMVGEHPLYGNAFVDADGNGFSDFVNEPLAFGSGHFTMKRAMQFDGLSVAPDPVARHDDLTVTGRLSRANWDTGGYDAAEGPVTVQYRRDGRDRWKNVARVWADGGAVSATLRSKRSGEYRLHYDGDDISGAVDSAAVSVEVTRH